MKNKFIIALFMSIFALIAGGCQSPADNSHAMRMNYRSERYTDDDFDTVTEMIVKDLQQNHPERKAVRFAYAGDEASDYYGSLANAQEDRDGMLFFIHFEDSHDDEFICFFSRDEDSDEWQSEGTYSSGSGFTVPNELLPQEVVNAREEVQERFFNE